MVKIPATRPTNKADTSRILRFFVFIFGCFVDSNKNEDNGKNLNQDSQAIVKLSSSHNITYAREEGCGCNETAPKQKIYIVPHVESHSLFEIWSATTNAKNKPVKSASPIFA